MDLNHNFTVEKPIDEAWKILTNVELIAPCLPGAQLEEVEGDTYRGMVKVKVGPISAAFKGQASFVERDDANYRAVLKGEGRDTGGKGNASANITASMTSLSPTSTQVDVATDLTITGKVAQFGRGAMADISDKLLGQFVENLNALIAEQPDVAASEPSSAPTDGGVRKIDGPEAQPLNLVGAAGLPILKRALPVAVIVAVVIWLIVR
jgi:carbon monoxide dehydrogenase subunit G